jgi:hypothetical protein
MLKNSNHSVQERLRSEIATPNAISPRTKGLSQRPTCAVPQVGRCSFCATPSVTAHTVTNTSFATSHHFAISPFHVHILTYSPTHIPKLAPQARPPFSWNATPYSGSVLCLVAPTRSARMGLCRVPTGSVAQLQSVDDSRSRERANELERPAYARDRGRHERDVAARSSHGPKAGTVRAHDVEMWVRIPPARTSESL